MLFLKDQFINEKKSNKNNEILGEAFGNDDIRDMFLDDPDTVVSGSENDEDVEKAVDKLPGFDFKPTDDPDDDADLSELIENFIPDSLSDGDRG